MAGIEKESPNIITKSTNECRICLQAGDIPIFGDGSRPNISKAVMTFGCIRISGRDDLPKHICQECHSLLLSAIRFRSTAKQSHIVLSGRKSGKRRTQGPKPWNKTVKKEELREKHDTELPMSIEPKSEFALLDSVDDNISEIKDEFSENEFDDTNTNKMLVTKEENNIHDSESITKPDISEVSDTDQEVEGNKDDQMMDCEICYKTLYNRSSYNRHKRDVHKIMPSRFLLKKEHYSDDVTDKGTIACKICNKEFDRDQYNQHITQAHNIESKISIQKKHKRECEICKKYVSAMYYSRHIKHTHSTSKDNKWKKKSQCPVCKKYYSDNFLKLHVKHHELEKQGCDTLRYVCDQCGKKFKWAATFSAHILIHSNELPFQCEYCPYRGRSRNLLIIHIRTHTGDYRHKCTQCSACYTTKSNLNKHMQRHRGAVDFKCDICKKGFYSKPDLERHIEVTHLGQKNHVCNICGMAFGYRRGMMNHQLKVHKREKVRGGRQPLYMMMERGDEVISSNVV